MLSSLFPFAQHTATLNARYFFLFEYLLLNVMPSKVIRAVASPCLLHDILNYSSLAKILWQICEQQVLGMKMKKQRILSVCSRLESSASIVGVAANFKATRIPVCREFERRRACQYHWCGKRARQRSADGSKVSRSLSYDPLSAFGS